MATVELSLRRWTVAALLVTVAACGRPAPPDIIVISLDTLRRDEVGIVSGEPGSRTPTLDALAAESLVFTDAWAQVPFTLPSHMSIFTGLYPDVHGVERKAARLADGIPTLPELLRAAGYHTVGVVTNLWMTGEFGFARGFDQYERLPYGLVYADRVNRRAFELLDDRGDDRRPLFLFLHYIDPHSDFFNVSANALPYYAPPEFLAGLDIAPDSREFCDAEGNCATEFLLAADREGRPLDPATVDRIAALYGRGVSYLDHELGALIDGLRRRALWDDSLVLVTSDHGEEFRDHGRFIHVQPYVENLAVPLLLKLPNAERGGGRIAATVETVDYLPTLLDAAGAPHPPHLQGRSLLPLAHGEAAAERPAFGRDKLDRQRFTLRRGQWTLLHHLGTGRSELYDRLADPAEQADLAERQPERVAALRAELLAIVAANRELATAFAAAPAGGDILTDDETEKLRAIGYVE
jgi:arylsulfatase A-like enzyme